MRYNEDLLKIYADSFRRNWDLPAISEYGSKEPAITYEEFARRIARIHLFFELAGVKPGDKIALLGKNTPTWVNVFIATITYGAVIVPILPDFNPVDSQHIINHSDAVALFVSESKWEHLEYSNLTGIQFVISLETRKVLAERDSENVPVTKMIDALTDSFSKRYPRGFRREDVVYKRFPADHLAEINYTSGTTGFSKGVMLTLDNLCGNVAFGIEQNLHYSGSRCLSFLPLAHAYGCAFDMLTPLAAGTHITLFGKVPTPRLLLSALAEVRPSLVVCVPLILEKIYKKQIVPMISKGLVRWGLMVPMLDSVIFSKIRKKLVDAFGGEFTEVIVGGAPLNSEVEQFLRKIKFPFTVGYGMTECAPLISYAPAAKFVISSSGTILPNMEAKIVSDDPVGIPGEICVRGQNVMKGYYKNPDATEMAIDAEGWLHTGDMGTLSPDNTLFIKGRYKTMILTASGQNIYPEEIEAKLNNMPFVAESLVLQRGNGLVALVYPDYEQADAENLVSYQLKDIMEKNRVELNSLVAPYEQVNEIRLVPEEFEKTPKKSIKRYLYNV